MDEIPQDLREKLVCISREEVEDGKIDGKLRLIRMDLPIYISIDKDVLDRGEAENKLEPGGHASVYTGETPSGGI